MNLSNCFIILTDLCGIFRSNEGYCGNVTFSEQRAALIRRRFDFPEGGRGTLIAVAWKHIEKIEIASQLNN